MINRIILSLASTFVLNFLFTPYVYAQGNTQENSPKDIQIVDPGQIIPGTRPTTLQPPFLGEDHNYTVVFRGNGETIVTLKTIFSNLGETPLESINLRMPTKVRPSDIISYQVIRDPICLRYEYQVQFPVCEEYQEPDYYKAYNQAKYQKADFELKGDILSVQLPKSVKPNGQGGIFIYFRAFGYAKKNIFDAYNFTFETLKVDDKIRNLQVGISTDSDFLLKGTRGKVDYRFDENTVSKLESSGAAHGAVESPAFDAFYNQIGRGTVTKTASNLASLESYKVEGSYASSQLKLYAREIVIVLGIILLTLLIGVLAIRSLLKRLSGEKEEAKPFALYDSKTIVAAVLISLVSPLLMLGYTVLVVMANRLLVSSYLYGYDLVVVIVIFLVILSICVYAIFLLGPAIFFALKKGWKWGIGEFLLTVFWLAFYIGVITVVLFLIKQTGSPYPLEPSILY